MKIHEDGAFEDAPECESRSLSIYDSLQWTLHPDRAHFTLWEAAPPTPSPVDGATL
jgi:hypothetical protein